MTEQGYREGGTEAPVRHPLDWRNPEFRDAAAIEAETRRVFDICHGCRRCFNLCDSFPRLFDLIDESETGELDSVDAGGFAAVVEACTLCDMCFMTKCPYVPPHDFNIDFPHVMLRHRAAAFEAGKVGFVARQLARTDRNGQLAARLPALVNWAGRAGNRLTRPLLEWLAGIHRDAALPRFHRKTLMDRQGQGPDLGPDSDHRRKAVLFATCFGNYNRPQIGEAARAVLAQNGVAVEFAYAGCCGMPLLEQGDLEGVAAAARSVSESLEPWIDKGYDVIALVPSCTLMLKFEWPLIVPGEARVAKLAAAVSDIAEYVVALAREGGLAEGLTPLDGGIAVHVACHARAQNVGAKAADMLRLIPDTDIQVMERCSGHGGSWGLFKDNFEVALKVGKPVARTVLGKNCRYLASECPLAAEHILQGMERLAGEDGNGAAVPPRGYHPIELLAQAYGENLEP